MAETTDGTVSASASSGALAGVKIVDLTRVLGGPFATQLLADHGADVIKLEPPMGDEVRDWGPPFHDGDASYYIGINRNKRSIGLDLAQADRPRGAAEAPRRSRRADRELQARLHGSVGHRLRGFEEALPQAHLLQDIRLRR